MRWALGWTLRGGIPPGRDRGKSDPGFVRADDVHKAGLSSEEIEVNMWDVTALCERGAVCASCVESFSAESSLLTRGAAYEGISLSAKRAPLPPSGGRSILFVAHVS